MKRINEIVVVEGKTDSQLLKELYDVDTIETHGLGLDDKTLELIKEASKTRGVIVLTDPDYPGLRIRNQVEKYVQNCKHAFVDRKDAIGKKKLGIAEANKEAVKKAIENVVTFSNQEESISWKEFLELDIIGDKKKRLKIYDLFHLGYGNAKTLFKRLNMVGISREMIVKDIATKSTTQYILDKYDLYPKKKYGQNFLIDPHVVEKIVRCSSVNEKCAVIEVGPGIGALTQVLARYAGYVRSYEIDTRFKGVYEEFLNQENIEIVFEDFLKVNLEDLMTLKDKYEKVILVANLPYYITTQIIEKVLTESKVIDEIVVMVQKEVALKYTSDYKSPLMYMIEDMGKIEYMFTVSQNVFIPAPHIDSAILKITINKEANLDLYKVLNSAFKQRRKTIYNNLKQEYQNALDVLNENQIDQKLRCEQLTLEDYQAITKSLYKHTI